MITNNKHKKLIEVALPLPEINDASAYDKMPGIGAHPKGIHNWWARLPLPTARAVLFASTVDDPEAHPEKWPTEEAQNAERERLFDILRLMMGKKLHESPEVYAAARAEMLKSCSGNLPPVFDPFAGGGSIPLEANRMGFEAHAGDLNPIAVLLNKCNLELAPRWVTHPPVNPEDRRRIGGGEAWRGTHGLAADIRHYGRVIRERAIEKIGQLYPTVRLPKDQGGGDASVIAWIWARTVASPNPAAQGRHVPIVSSYMLSNRKHRAVWIEPIIDDSAQDGWRFDIREGTAEKSLIDKARLGSRAGRAQDFICLLTGQPIPRGYIQAEGKAQRLRQRLMAVIASGHREKVYLTPTPEQEGIELSLTGRTELNDARSTFLSGTIPDRAGITGGVCSAYGLSTWGDLFTSRQLKALLTFSDLIRNVLPEIENDAAQSGLDSSASHDYALTVATFLTLNLSRSADLNNSLCTWNASDQVLRNLFKRQAIPMVWDFAEANILGDVVGGWSTCVERTERCVTTLNSATRGFAQQNDAANASVEMRDIIVSTDPPYYNNIGYAVLSDFFYVWIRRTIGDQYSDLFSTVLVPKLPELTASPDRFDGDHNKAKEHFENGFRRSFSDLKSKLDTRFPLTVYYAFKQDDEDGSSTEDNSGVDLTTGWETLLEALISSGFQITATWPVRASQKWRIVSMGTNALASYIVLACRPRAADAPQISSAQFRQELKRTLPTALRHLQQGNIAPVDFAQAALGPGMAVYSRYSRILESSGKPMSVRPALGIINQMLTEVLSELEDDFDADTRWAIAWFEQHGFRDGEYGDAELLSKAKVTSVEGLHQAGIVKRGGGKVRLLRPDELPANWDPASDKRVTVWEMTHHLLRLYNHEKAGDEATAALLRKLGSAGEVTRELAYRLFNVAERKKLSQEAQGYNALVLGWPEIARLARAMPAATEPAQGELI